MSSADLLERFGGLPFTVEAELGSLELPIREILDLKKGAVLPTNRPSGSTFTLCAGGEPIAEVEFVVLGDSLSVRIVKVFERSTSNPGANGTD